MPLLSKIEVRTQFHGREFKIMMATSKTTRTDDKKYCSWMFTWASNSGEQRINRVLGDVKINCVAVNLVNSDHEFLISVFYRLWDGYTSKTKFARIISPKTYKNLCQGKKDKTGLTRRCSCISLLHICKIKACRYYDTCL